VKFRILSFVLAAAILLAALALAWWMRSLPGSSREGPGLRGDVARSSSTNEAAHLPVEPPPEATATAQPVASLLTSAVETQAQQSPVRPDGRFSRVRMVTADFVYPFLRVEETWSRDARSAKETMERRDVMVADHILVRLRSGASREDLERLNAGFGARIRRPLLAPALFLVELPYPDANAVPDAVTNYRRHVDLVAYAEPDYLVFHDETFPNDPDWALLYGLHNTGQTGGAPDADIDAPAAWDYLTGGDVVVGVLDTGIDYLHEDLAANLWVNPGEIPGDGLDNDSNGFADDIYGWDFINDDADPMDDNSHGSHVAGTIAAAGNNGLGVAGINWSCKLMALKFLNAGGSGPTSDAVDAMAYLLNLKRHHGVNLRLTSNSWGSDSPSQALADMIEESREENMLFVAAAGNSARDTDLYPHYPSSFTNQNILSVASTDRSDGKSGFSNYGMVTVDLGAPGSAIYSTTPGSAYGTKSGTSMATPHVAGVAALIWNFSPEETYQNVREVILIGTDPLPALYGITVSGGRLNAVKALANLGMRVRDSTPGRGDVVAAPPIDFTVEFTHEYEPSTLASNDFSVNGVVSDAVTLSSTNLATFHFNASPVVTQGVQVIDMAAGCVDRAGAAESIAAYHATFRYDTELMEIVATEPVDGSIADLPFLRVLIHLNEPFATGSVGVADLLLSEGRVTNAVAIDADTIAYDIEDVEGEGVLTAQVPDGALTDEHGNPGTGGRWTWHLDGSGLAYPTPFASVPPAGSLIYDPPVEAFITPPGDTDAYLLALDAGQTLAVKAEGDSELRVRVEVRTPEGLPLASATAATAGGVAILPGSALPTAGTYQVTFSGADDTAGKYEASLYLNTAIEHSTEPENGSLAGAEDLDPVFTPLGTGGAERAAAWGRIASTTTVAWKSQDFENGALDSAWSVYGSQNHARTRLSSEPPASHGAYALLMDVATGGTYALNEAIWTVDARDLNQAFLRFAYASWFDEVQTFGGDFTNHFNADGIAISDDGVVWYPVWSAPGSLAPGTWHETELDLIAAARKAGMRSGPDLRIKFQQYDNAAIPEDGRGWDNIRISVPGAETDWYRFSGVAGDRISAHLLALQGGRLGLILADSGGGVVATAPENGRSSWSIPQAVLPATGEYGLQISGAGSEEYTLVVTRNALFAPSTDIEVDLTGYQGVLGSLACTDPLFAVDWRFPPPCHLVALDPATGREVRRFHAPVTPVDHPSRHNLASDGTHLWFNGGSDDTNSVTIYQLDAQSGAPIRSFAAAIPVPTALACLNGELYACAGNAIHVYDTATFSLQRTLLPPVAGELRGLEGDEARGVIWAVSLFQRLYKLDPLTGAILSERNTSGERRGLEQGMGIACDELYVAESGVSEIAVYDAETLASLRRIPAPVTELLGGLAGFNRGVPEHRYGIRAEAGDLLSVETWTPSGEPLEPGEFRNALDPEVVLHDPQNAAAAVDGEGPDGKNSLVQFATATTGVHTVTIRGEQRTRGEYVLRVSGSSAAADQQPPVLICPTDRTLYAGAACRAGIPDLRAEAIVTDDVSASTEIAVYQAPSPGTPRSAGEWPVVLTAVDRALHASTCTVWVSVQTDPALYLDTPPDSTIGCASSSLPQETGLATASNLCGDAILLGYTDVVTAATCPAVEQIVRTWSAASGSNSTSTIQTITRMDVEPPLLTAPPSTAVKCSQDVSPASLGEASAIDACDPFPAVTFADTVVTARCVHAFTLQREWTAVDRCGNTTQVVQVIEVEEDTSPELAVPPDLTVECDAGLDPETTGFATATDSCDVTPAVTYSDVWIAGPVEALGTLLRTWRATDACGNWKEEVQVIDVSDLTPPAVETTNELRLVADSNGWAVLPDVSASSLVTDNCSPAPSMLVTQAPHPFTVLATGFTQAWVQAIDRAGNVESVSVDVLVAPGAPWKAPVPPYFLGGSNLVEWSPVAGASWYQAAGTPDTAFPFAAVAEWQTAPGFLLPGFAAATQHFYRARAAAPGKTGLIESAWSDWSVSIHLDENGDWDQDGLPNQWEHDVQFDPLVPNDGDANPDGDHLTTFQEYLADTLPTNRESDLRLLDVYRENEETRIRWRGGQLATQLVYFSESADPAVWRPLLTNYPPTPITNQVTLPLTGTSGYFRLEATR